MKKVTKAQQAIEETPKKPACPGHNPPAGPHDKRNLQEENKTPGSSLPDKGDDSVLPDSSIKKCAPRLMSEGPSIGRIVLGKSKARRNN